MIIMGIFILVGEVSRLINPLDLSYGIKMAVISLSQILLVFLPTFIFIYFNKLNLKDLRFNKISMKNLLIAIGIMVFSMPIAMFINFIWIFILRYFGEIYTPAQFSSDNIVQLLINLFVIAILPAIFEEMLFRGVILRGYERLGKVSAILCSAILFGLLHRDLQSLVGTTILGIVIAFIVYKTNSIYPGMIAHFINNGFAIVLTFLISKISPFALEQLKNPSAQDMFNNSTQVIIAFAFLGITSIIFSGGLIGLIILFNYTTKDIYKQEEVEVIAVENNKEWLLPLGISLMLVFYAYFR